MREGRNEPAGSGVERTAELARASEASRAEDSLRFMAEASAELSSSLDYRDTLSGVARLAVPRLADWCAVDVITEDGSVERLAVEHEDRRKIALAIELQERYPPEPESRSGLPNVLRTGRAECYPEISDEMLRSAATDEEHLGLLRELGFTSAMIVPMIARGRTLGAITLVSAESGRSYGEADLRLTEELARRAALAVDNARLYGEAQKEVAERRRAQEELRGSKDQLEIILRGVADGITAQEPSGRIIYANEAAARMVGYPSARALMEAPPGEVLRKFEVLNEEGRPFPLERLPGRRALLGEDAEETLRFRVLGTGEERWAVVRATPVFDERGTVRMAVNIFRDITERRRAEVALRELREAERRRIAHDLHDGVLQDLSYTAASMGLILLQTEGTSLENEVQAAIDAVRRAARGLRDAVNDLRLEEETDRPFPELVESLVKRNRTMSRGGYETSLEVEEGFLPAPLGETGTQLSRIIQEALTNARRHSGARNILVSLRIEGEDLVSEVSDDGQGFMAAAAPGVGLKSMQERAQALGGTLEIESEPGKGTRVRIRVPLARKV
ncbi:MAG TPA: ATP-binding protein [Rubrobacteraceae bacterium]|nr:ATP-binding protein [Rubrobacteraceae bacterium]